MYQYLHTVPRFTVLFRFLHHSGRNSRVDGKQLKCDLYFGLSAPSLEHLYCTTTECSYHWVCLTISLRCVPLRYNDKWRTYRAAVVRWGPNLLITRSNDTETGGTKRPSNFFQWGYYIRAWSGIIIANYERAYREITDAAAPLPVSIAMRWELHAKSCWRPLYETDIILGVWRAIQ